MASQPTDLSQSAEREKQKRPVDERGEQSRIGEPRSHQSAAARCQDVFFSPPAAAK